MKKLNLKDISDVLQADEESDLSGGRIDMKAFRAQEHHGEPTKFKLKDPSELRDQHKKEPPRFKPKH